MTFALTQDYGDRLMLCGEISPKMEELKQRSRSVSEVSAPAVDKDLDPPPLADRLLLSGDIESNPGPRR